MRLSKGNDHKETDGPVSTKARSKPALFAPKLRARKALSNTADRANIAKQAMHQTGRLYAVVFAVEM